MSDPAQVLRDFKPTKEFFIGIDSDGCIFDSMEIKHKECFTPMFIKHFRLQAVSKYAREVWDFVNLYSKTRGANRFPALVRALNLLRERPQVQARQVSVADTKALEEWIARETKLGNATLKAEVERGNKGLEQVKVWSDAVNEAIEDLVHGVPPFPLVRESLEEAQPGRRRDVHFADARRGAEARVGRARHRPARENYRRPGDGHEDRAPEVRRSRTNTRRTKS